MGSRRGSPASRGSNVKDPNAATARSSLAQAGEQWLHRLEGREETDWAVCQLRSELCARLTKDFAGDRSRRKDCLHEVGDVRGVLDERLGIPEPLVDDGALALWDDGCSDPKRGI